MTKRDVVSVALRIIGITTCFTTIMGIASALMVSSQPVGDAQTTDMYNYYTHIQLISSVIFFVIGTILISFSERISSFLIRKDTEMKTPEIIGNEPQIIAIAFLLIGVYFVLQNIPALISNIIVFFQSFNDEQIKIYGIVVNSRNNLYPMLTKSIISIVLGGLLAFKATYISNWFCGITSDNDEVSGDE